MRSNWSSIQIQKSGITKFGVEDKTFNFSAPVGMWTHLALVSDGKTVGSEFCRNAEVKISAREVNVNGENKKPKVIQELREGSEEPVRLICRMRES